MLVAGYVFLEHTAEHHTSEGVIRIDRAVLAGFVEGRIGKRSVRGSNGRLCKAVALVVPERLEGRAAALFLGNVAASIVSISIHDIRRVVNRFGNFTQFVVLIFYNRDSTAVIGVGLLDRRLVAVRGNGYALAGGVGSGNGGGVRERIGVFGEDVPACGDLRLPSEAVVIEAVLEAVVCNGGEQAVRIAVGDGVVLPVHARGCHRHGFCSMIVGVGGTHAAGVGNVIEKSAVLVIVVLGTDILPASVRFVFEVFPVFVVGVFLDKAFLGTNERARRIERCRVVGAGFQDLSVFRILGKRYRAAVILRGDAVALRIVFVYRHELLSVRIGNRDAHGQIQLVILRYGSSDSVVFGDPLYIPHVLSEHLYRFAEVLFNVDSVAEGVHQTNAGEGNVRRNIRAVKVHGYALVYIKKRTISMVRFKDFESKYIILSLIL